MAELTLDIFNNDAFSNASMTNFVNTNIPFVPGLLGSLGLFTAEGVYTPTIMFDDENGSLSLIETSARHSAPSQSKNNKGVTRSLQTVRLAREAAINADQVANVRVLGTATQLQTAERIVMKRVEGPTGLKAELGYTLEHMYLGAVDGVVVDADGATTLWDYFSFYGVARPDPVNFAFSTMTSDGSAFATGITGAKRTMIRALSGFSPAAGQAVALCGDNFYDAAWGNKEVTAARKALGTTNMQAMSFLSENKAFDSFSYGGVTWVNYRGSDDGTVGIPTDEGRMFLQGVPGLFRTFFAPADTWDLVNTEGLPSYLIQRRERQTESQRVFELQSNPLAMCMRPKSLLRLTKS